MVKSILTNHPGILANRGGKVRPCHSPAVYISQRFESGLRTGGLTANCVARIALMFSGSAVKMNLSPLVRGFPNAIAEQTKKHVLDIPLACKIQFHRLRCTFGCPRKQPAPKFQILMVAAGLYGVIDKIETWVKVSTGTLRSSRDDSRCTKWQEASNSGCISTQPHNIEMLLDPSDNIVDSKRDQKECQDGLSVQ